LTLIGRTTSPRVRAVTWVVLPAFLVAFSLYGSWAPVSDSSRVFGLPYSDAHAYFDAALRLDSGLHLTDFAGRRPLYTGFLSSVLAMTGYSLTMTCALQTLIVALAICWFSEQVALRFGFLEAVTSGVLLSVFFVRFVEKTLSENLGLLLGLVGWGLLVRWCRRRHSSDAVLGYFALTLGLLARAGAFLVLPALLLALGRGSNRRARAPLLVFSLAVAAAGVAIDLAYRWRFGTNSTESFSNFSFVLYGVARGGVGWQSATEVFGTSPAASQQIYAAALASIRHEPLLFVIGASKAVWQFLLPGLLSATGFAAMHAPSPLRPLAYLVASAVFWIGLFQLFRPTAWPEQLPHHLERWGMIGLLLSLPFAPPSDSDVMRAHAVAIPLVVLTMAHGARGLWTVAQKLARRQPGRPPAAAITGGGRQWAPFPLAVLFIVMLLVLWPLTRQGGRPAGTDASNTCSPARALTLQHIFHGTTISSQAQIERTQRTHPYPALFEPLKVALTRAGPYEFTYGYSLAIDTTPAVLFPLAMSGIRSDAGVLVCAVELDSPITPFGKPLPVWLVTRIN
jgi:hypothetical protein